MRQENTSENLNRCKTPEHAQPSNNYSLVYMVDTKILNLEYWPEGQQVPFCGNNSGSGHQE